MTTKYTKAYSLTPHNTNAVDPRPDAYYVGDGNFTDGHDTDDFYDPKLWYRGGEQLAVGGAVTYWENKVNTRFSTMEAYSVVATAGNATTNYVDYLTFDAASDYLKTDNTPANYDIGTGEFEMMAVVRFADNGNAYQHIAARDTGASNWSWLRRSDAAGSNPGKMTFSMSGTDPVSADAPAYDTWFIMGVSRDSSNNVQLYRNGATDGSSVSNSADLDNDSDDDLFLGCKSADGTTGVQSLLGDMAEFILWEEQLSTAERAAVVGHLQDRYFNDRRGKLVTCTDPSDGDTYSVTYPPIGKIINDSPKYIRDAGKQASDIVGLLEK
jgi:hypothetical protein